MIPQNEGVAEGQITTSEEIASTLNFDPIKYEHFFCEYYRGCTGKLLVYYAGKECMLDKFKISIMVVFSCGNFYFKRYSVV